MPGHDAGEYPEEDTEEAAPVEWPKVTARLERFGLGSDARFPDHPAIPYRRASPCQGISYTAGGAG